MWKIFFAVKNIFDYQFKDATDDFKEGFRKCFMLFEIGYEKTTRTLLSLEYRKLVDDFERLSKRIVLERKTYENKIQKLEDQNLLLEEKVKRLVPRTDEPDDLKKQLVNERKRFEKTLTEMQIENMILAEKVKRLVARTDEPGEMKMAG